MMSTPPVAAEAAQSTYIELKWKRSLIGLNAVCTSNVLCADKLVKNAKIQNPKIRKSNKTPTNQSAKLFRVREYFPVLFSVWCCAGWCLVLEYDIEGKSKRMCTCVHFMCRGSVSWSAR